MKMSLFNCKNCIAPKVNCFDCIHQPKLKNLKDNYIEVSKDDDKVISFIKRRFSQDFSWMNGNCYFFAQILRKTFGGDIIYDPIDGHFMCYIDNTFYDWSGKREFTTDQIKNFYNWEDLYKEDRTSR